jgi:hypothetical protein
MLFATRLLILAVAAGLTLSLVGRADAQYIAYSAPAYVTSQGGVYTAYSAAPGTYYYGRPRHHHHFWRHHGHGFVQDVLIPGAVQLLQPNAPGTVGGGNPEPPVQWRVPQEVFNQQESAACQQAQATLAKLVALRQHFPEVQFQSPTEAACYALPADANAPPGGGGADVELPPGVQP